MCKSTNLVYCITCTRCSKQYVGQTKGTLMDRFKAHFGVINRRDMKEDIGHHFNSAKHHGTDDMAIHVLDFIYAPATAEYCQDLRLQLEFNWIHRLRTMLPTGINTKEAPYSQKHCRNWKYHKETNIIKVNAQSNLYKNE